eukprot:3200609-Prymnesium_polylepis.1
MNLQATCTNSRLPEHRWQMQGLAHREGGVRPGVRPACLRGAPKVISQHRLGAFTVHFARNAQLKNLRCCRPSSSSSSAASRQRRRSS